MTMQVSERPTKAGKSKAKQTSNKKLMKEQNASTPFSSSGENSVKLESGVKQEGGDLANEDRKPDIRQFNGHFDTPGSDGTRQLGQDGTSTPNNNRVTMGSQPGMGGPPNYPFGQQMSGGHMQLAPGGHYIQHQNQIFVFSTAKANDAAQAVASGKFKNIIEFHANQPDTRQFLQKFPLASPQISGPMGMSLNSDGCMRQIGTTTQGEPVPESGGSALANVAQWVQQQNANLQQDRSFSPNSSNLSFSQQEMMGVRPNGRFNPAMQHWGSSSPGPPHMIDPIRGGPPQGGYPIGGGGFMHDMAMTQMHNKNSNENLTQEKLQRREEQLANLRKIGQMLSLEPQQQNMDCPGGPMMQGGGPMMQGLGGPMMQGPGGMMMQGPGGPMMHGPGGPMMQGPDGEMWMSSPHMMHHPGMGPPHSGMMGSPPNCPPGMNFPIGPSLPPNWENMTPAQQDWYKLQQEHYMDKIRKQQMQMPMSQGGHPGFFNPVQGGPHRMGRPMSPMSPGMMPPSHFGPGGEQFFLQKQQQGEFGPPMNFFPEQDGMFPFNDGPMPPPGRLLHGEHFMGDFNPGNIHEMNRGFIVEHGIGSHKRKRSSNMQDPDEIHKRLLPAPSPQQFSYMNPLEGQELIITKTLNLAYQESGNPSPTPPTIPVPPPKARATTSKKKKKVPTATLR